MKPLVSVVLPTYRQPQFLRTSVLSILAQTYGNVELILVTVEGDADTEKAVAPFLAWTDCVHTVQSSVANIIHQINLGLKRAKGEYVTLFASDDFMLPNKIASEVNLALKRNAVLVYSAFFLGDENLNPVGLPKIPDFSYETLIRRNYITDNSLVQRRVYEEFGLFNESLEILAVYDKWLHVAERYPERIVRNPHPTFIYRQHPDQAHKQRLSRADRFELYRKVISASLKRKGVNINPKRMKFRITEA